MSLLRCRNTKRSSPAMDIEKTCLSVRTQNKEKKPLHFISVRVRAVTESGQREQSTVWHGVHIIIMGT